MALLQVSDSNLADILIPFVSTLESDKVSRGIKVGLKMLTYAFQLSVLLLTLNF